MVRLIFILLLFASCKKEKCYQCDYFYDNNILVAEWTLCTDEQYQTKKELEQKYTNDDFYLRCR
jgi:hypothetical protein